MIELRNIVKIFDTKDGNVHAVNDVSIHVDKKDVYGVIGFSGAGKSTLIRCINLLERPTSGDVIVKGKNLKNMNAKELRTTRKKIGMIFQHFNLMRSRTVYDNVAYPLKGNKLTKQQIKEKVDSLLALVELSDRGKSYPSQLSGGQKQRVAIARALANDPDVLLCDEATSALDPQTTQSILALLKSLNEKLNITIVIITHEMSVVKAICNKVAIMELGKVIEEGKIESVFVNPKHQVTKKFIDSTTEIHKIYEMIETNNPLVELGENEILIRLLYSNSNTKEALMTYLIKNYDVSFNIVFGNIELLNGNLIGNLVVKLAGTKTNVEKSIVFIKAQDVKVEVLK